MGTWMNWSYRYPALTHWGDESTTHVTLHLCGFLLVCDQCVCFLRMYKLVDKGQYFCLYSLHCCTLQMAPWIFLLTCYTLVFVYIFLLMFFYLEVYLLLDLINLFTWLLTILREKKPHKKPKPVTLFWGETYPSGASSNVILDSSSLLWKIIQMVLDPQTSNMDVDFPLTNLMAFGVLIIVGKKQMSPQKATT